MDENYAIKPLSGLEVGGERAADMEPWMRMSMARIECECDLD